MSLATELHALNPRDNAYATRFVDLLLAAARENRASDIHLQPLRDQLEIRWRLDGVLQTVGRFPTGQASDVIARLKVLAELLTYRNDIPQEGRIRETPGNVEMRVSTFPTLYGERAVVRMFAAHDTYLRIGDLGLPADVVECMSQVLGETSGMLLVTGPAGSGKTTTVYAALREIVFQSGSQKNIVSLEDPIEVAVEGVAQSQVKPAAGFDLATGLRSLMRQDPEVIIVGAIRHVAPAEAASQATLTGHLVLTTFHAGSAAGAINRLADMGIEPYQLRSGIQAILSQRLVRKLCDCSRESALPADRLGLDVDTARLPGGCANCLNTGYRGRAVLAELLVASPDELGRAILSRSDSAQLEQLAIAAGMKSQWARAFDAVRNGVTSPAEVRRVLGFSR